jgi:preprotein translocase subunit YajC
MPTQKVIGRMDDIYVDEADSFFLTMNNRLRPSQLQPGQVAMSVNGRMGLDGAWQPRKGASYFGPVLAVSNLALTLPFYLYANVTISSATRSAATVTVTTSTSHNFTTSTQVGIGGISGTVDPTGNRTITVTGATTFTFTIAGATGSETYTLGGTPFAGAPFVSIAINAAYGSCAFSDPSNDNSQYIVMALNDKAVAVDLVTGDDTDIAYPSGMMVTEPVEMIQAFDKIYIFRDGATALEWNGVLTGTPAFVKVANGNYTQPLVLSTANNATCSGGVVTITNTHNLAVGDEVTIMDEGTTGLIRFDKYSVASVTGTTSFTFYASIDDFTATSVVLGKRQSNGRGFTHMPAPPWAVYHQRRLICPYNYTTTGTSGSEVITSRDVRDELIFSDILDAETYDQLVNDFRVTAGISDYIQTVHPFTDDAAIAFNRHSLHLITGLSDSLADVAIKEITRENGLVARKSVVTIGNSVFFLSDNGIYSAEFGDLYNLRGAKVPLSDAIDPIIKRINSAYAYKAVAAFHDNRYYLAIPLDASTTNNAIIVYNVLNGGWESLDLIEQNGWDVTNFIVGSPNGINKLYAINSYGGINILEEREDDVDNIYTLPGLSATSYPIESYVTSRQYTISSTERKKYTNFEIQVKSTDTNASNATISGIFENVDDEREINTISGLYGSVLEVSEDVSLRGRIGGIRSYGMQLKFSPTAGRPELRLIKVSATQALNSLTTAS